MRRFKNILYFADGVADRTSALNRAISLADSNHASLTVFDVVPEQGDSAGRIERRIEVDIDRALREEREAELADMISGLRDIDRSVIHRVVTGIPFLEVIRAVLAEGYDLVTKAARPPDSFVKRTLGSTDLHLLRKCPCPIWIDRPDAATPYRTVLAAVDPVDSEYEDSARLIMDLATSLAKRENAGLAIVHAWRLRGEELMRSGQAGISSAELELLIDEKRDQHGELLGSLLAHYGIKADDAAVHLVKGDPAQSIRKLSLELDADLVVMGTLGRRGIPGVFIGNTAEDVLQTTQASVLAIKPLGFVSPVMTE
jgi:universal stress protein E